MQYHPDYKEHIIDFDQPTKQESVDYPLRVMVCLLNFRKLLSDKSYELLIEVSRPVSFQGQLHSIKKRYPVIIKTHSGVLFDEAKDEQDKTLGQIVYEVVDDLNAISNRVIGSQPSDINYLACIGCAREILMGHSKCAAIVLH